MGNSSTTADEILACARALIVSGGYNGFSYADISEVVGIRKASIHHHFPSKAELVRTLVAQYRAEAQAGMAAQELHEPDPAGLLRLYVGYWEGCIAEGSAPICICALLASQLPALPGEVALEVRAHFRMLSAWLTSVMERGAQTGKLRLSGTAREEAEGFMAAAHGAMLAARAYADTKLFSFVMAPLLARLTAA